MEFLFLLFAFVYFLRACFSGDTSRMITIIATIVFGVLLLLHFLAHSVAI